MPIVYRIQDLTGRGPFKPGFSHVWVIPRPQHDKLKPIYEDFPHYRLLLEEALGRGFTHFGTGCLSLEQLREWFIEPEYRKLLVLGYRAVKLEVDEILAESDIQCLFARRMPLWMGAEEVKLYE